MTIAVSTQTGTQSADAVDFTGRTLAMRVYEVGSVGQNPDYDDEYLIALTEGSGITVVGSRTDGVFTYAFTSTQTRALRDNGWAPRQVKRQLSLRTLTGTIDGTIADVAAVATAGGNTYADSAINTAITSVNLQHKELQAVLNNVVNSHNALLTQLQANGLIQAN